MCWLETGSSPETKREEGRGEGGKGGREGREGGRKSIACTTCTLALL